MRVLLALPMKAESIGTVRFLKNINGLFFISEVEKDFEQTDPQIGYPKISRLASQSKHQYMIDVRDNAL